MQRGSVDILKQLRQARSRLDKCIKQIEKDERHQRKVALKRQQDEHDQREANKEHIDAITKQTATEQELERETIPQKRGNNEKGKRSTTAEPRRI